MHAFLIKKIKVEDILDNYSLNGKNNFHYVYVQVYFEVEEPIQIQYLSFLKMWVTMNHGLEEPFHLYSIKHKWCTLPQVNLHSYPIYLHTNME